MCDNSMRRSWSSRGMWNLCQIPLRIHICIVICDDAQVQQSRNLLRANLTLGSFKLDVATVWAQPGTRFLWLPSLDKVLHAILHVAIPMLLVVWLHWSLSITMPRRVIIPRIAVFHKYKKIAIGSYTYVCMHTYTYSVYLCIYRLYGGQRWVPCIHMHVYIYVGIDMFLDCFVLFPELEWRRTDQNQPRQDKYQYLVAACQCSIKRAQWFFAL
jgi:hypothetical protein